MILGHVHSGPDAGPGVAGLVTAVAALLAAVVYGAAASRLRRRGDAWPWWRDASFTAGSAGLAWVAVGSLPGGALTAHMAQHLVVGMAAPLLFVLARPLTLALRALAPSAARRGLVALAHSRAVGWLVFPPWRPCWMSGVCGCCTAVACSPPCSTTRGCTRWSTYTF